MKLLDRLKKWFFKEENIGIINIGDLIQIPGREYFEDEQDKLDLIDKYKEEYLKLLSSAKISHSKDLSDNLQDEMIMNVDLILKLVVNHSDDIFSEIKKSKSDNEIDMYKLRLYLNRIEEMEKDNIARLIALKELEKGKRVPNKSKNALKEKINSLISNLVIFMGQKRAINIEIKAYLSNIVIDDSNTIGADDKLNELIDIASLYINVDDVISMDLKPEVKIAIIERRLEIFCYKNKKLKDELKDAQNQISKVVYSGSYFWREGILNQLTELENRYEVLIRYGYKIVSDKEIEEFYKLKFDVYTSDALNTEFLREPSNIFTEFTNRELKEYKAILQKKIEEIITGRNLIFWDCFYDPYLFNNNLSKAVSAFTKYLKDNSDTFDLEGIIKDPTMEKLSLILAFDSKDGLDEFFNKKLRKSHDIPIGALNDYIFSYGDSIPLSTALRVINPNELKNNIYFRELFNLYNLRKNNSTNYVLPSGITSIHVHKDLIEESYFAKKLRKEVKGKTIIMPDTLVSISGDLFEGVEIKNMILNDGLEYLWDHALDSVKDNGLIPPKTLLYADPQVLASLPKGAFPLFLRTLQENEALARGKRSKIRCRF